MPLPVFDETLWRSDLDRLELQHQLMATAVYDHAVHALGSQPYQRFSSRTAQSDFHTLFRTKLHGNNWLVLDTRMQILRVHLFDWDDAIHSEGPFEVVWTQQTQTKRWKRFNLPKDLAAIEPKRLTSFVDRIHNVAVEYFNSNP